MSNVTELRPKTTRFECKFGTFGLSDVSIVFDESHASATSDGPGHRHSEKRALKELHPRFSEETRGESRVDASRAFGRAWLLTAFSISLFFSSYYAEIPFLPWFLGIFALHQFIRGILGVRARTFTVIYDVYGRCFAELPHVSDAENRRVQFEKELESAIEQAKIKG